MKKLVKSHPIYFSVYLIFILVSTGFLAIYSKQEIHLFFNGFHSPSADIFFKYITDLGDGITLVVVGLLLLFISKRMTLQIALTGVISGAIAQLLKKVVFGPIARPSAFFADLGIPLHYIDGVDLHAAFSFPSGHATATFAMVTSILIFQKSSKFDFILIFIGLLIAYSRVYLSQHFLGDILTGSFIGSLTAFLVYYYLYSPSLLAKTKLDNPLINFSTK